MTNQSNYLKKRVNAHVLNTKAQQGVMLLEAMIALVLFSMGVLALVGLQAAMVSNTTNAKYRADASYLAQQRIGQMWADSNSDEDSDVLKLEQNTPVPELPNGLRTVTQPNDNQFVVTITWQAPGETEKHNVVMNATIAGLD